MSYSCAYLKGVLRSGSVTPFLTLALAASGEFHASLFPWGKATWCTCNVCVDVTQCQYGRFGGNKNLLPLLRQEPMFLSRPAHSLSAILLNSPQFSEILHVVSLKTDVCEDAKA